MPTAVDYETRHRNRINRLLTMPEEYWNDLYSLAMECSNGDHLIGVMATIGHLRKNPIKTTAMDLGDVQ